MNDKSDRVSIKYSHLIMIAYPIIGLIVAMASQKFGVVRSDIDPISLGGLRLFFMISWPIFILAYIVMALVYLLGCI